MRANLLAWDGKHFPLSLIKGSPMFNYLASWGIGSLTPSIAGYSMGANFSQKRLSRELKNNFYEGFKKSNDD
jgi:hypothetical protein